MNSRRIHFSVARAGIIHERRARAGVPPPDQENHIQLAHTPDSVLCTNLWPQFRSVATSLILLGLCSTGPAARIPSAESRFDLAFSTYLGGKEWEEAREILLLADGSWLVGAQANSTNMPVTPGVVQPFYAGDDPALGAGGLYGGDCFLIHGSADGRQVRAATYLGGSKQERNVYGMARDRQGNIVITTATRSPDAPTTVGAFQRTFGGGPSDMLVAKLTPDLRRVLWCTYVGGAGDDFPRGGLALDEEDNVYVVGTSTSANFPTTSGVFQRNLRGPRDSAIVKLKADGSGLILATLLGGAGEDDAIMGIRLDHAGQIFVAGHTKSTDFPVTPSAAQARLGGASDCYLAKLSADARHLVYASYLGGQGNEFAEHRPWLNPDGSILLAGFCDSSDFPTTAGAYQQTLRGSGDGFLVKLGPAGTNFTFATLLGGSGGENWLMPTVDAQGNIYIVGNTSSTNFPVTPDAFQRTYGGGANDGALAVFSPEGAELLYATFLGGSGEDLIRSIALGPQGELLLVGRTTSPDFPITAGTVQPTYQGGGDAFVMKLERHGRLRARLNQDQFEVGVLGKAGGRYAIETSLNPHTWTVWMSENTTGISQWLTDTRYSEAPARFYRAVSNW
jgi:hypothetical protein